MNASTYIGGELELFSQAVNWKAYVRSQIRPFLGERVLEVGAGIGGSTKFLCSERQTRWVCVEPDPTMASDLRAKIDAGELPRSCSVVEGTIDNVGSEDFDSILYLDVLEHIEDDLAEVARAETRLAVGGYLIALAPAHPSLYSPFDAAIGHFRRYTKLTLRRLTQGQLKLARLRYLDAVGLLASAGNRLLLKSKMPTPRQIALWDRIFVRASCIADPLTGYLVGKSLLAVWRKGPAP